MQKFNVQKQVEIIVLHVLFMTKMIWIIYLGSDLYHIIYWDLNTLILTQYDSDYLGIVCLDKSKNKVFKNKIKCNY